MEITPIPNSGPTARAAASRAKGRPAQPGLDTATFDRAEALKQALQETPLVRPEMVARARQYLGDVQYPPEATIRGISVLLGMKLDHATEGASQNEA